MFYVLNRATDIYVRDIIVWARKRDKGSPSIRSTSEAILRTIIGFLSQLLQELCEHVIRLHVMKNEQKANHTFSMHIITVIRNQLYQSCIC